MTLRFLPVLAACAALCAALTLGACDDGGPTYPGGDLVAAEARWNIHGFTFYALTQTANCFCVYGGAPMRLLVRGDSVLSAFNTRDSVDLPAEQRGWYLTVPQLFALVRDARARHAAKLEVRYDPTYGYPTRISIDYIAEAADDEIERISTDLQPLR